MGKILLKNGYTILGRFLSGLRIELLKIHFTSSFDDPCLTALAYGAAGAAMEGLRNLSGDRLRRADLRAEVDFDSGTPRLDARIRASMPLYRLLALSLRFGYGVLRDYRSFKREEYRV